MENRQDALYNALNRQEASLTRNIDRNYAELAKVSKFKYLLCGCLFLAGCGGSGADPKPQTAENKDLSDEALRDRLDYVLDWTYENRHLSLRDQAAWQILHGVLVYKQNFMVQKDGELVSAVGHVLGGGQMKGWDMEPGIVLDTATGRKGLRALMVEGVAGGQGHIDQWLAVLAQCDLPPETPILLRGHQYSMADWVEQAKLDVPRNIEHEYSWTLIGLTTYMPTTSSWKAMDGHEWSIEKLIQIEAEQDLSVSACGGTHRLIGMSMALNRHLEQGNQLTGSWKTADEVVRKAIEDARRYQNEDGTFSTNYFFRGGKSPDLAQNLSTSGHILEFLALSMTDEELKQPWVKRAVAAMCDIFEKTEQVDLECGALYHAAHGLDLYRLRMFGPKKYGNAEKDSNPPKTTPPASELNPPKPAGDSAPVPPGVAATKGTQD